MKNLIILCFTIFSMTSLSSQNSAFIIGINGGANFSKLSYTGDFAIQNEKVSRKLGFQGGLDLGFKFNSFSLLTGFRYVQRGGKTELRRDDPNNPFIFTDGTTDVGIQRTESNFSMINVPILFRYETSGDLAFSISLGPVLHFGIGDIITEETYELTVSGTRGPNEYKNSFGDLGNDLLKKSGLGFYFSPGVLYKIGDSGKLRFNFVFQTDGDLTNENLLVGDGFGGLRNVSGSIKSGATAFEIGYEHRIDFTMGAKY